MAVGPASNLKLRLKKKKPVNITLNGMHRNSRRVIGVNYGDPREIFTVDL